MDLPVVGLIKTLLPFMMRIEALGGHSMLAAISFQCKNLRWLICLLAIVCVESGCDLDDQSVNPFYLSQNVVVDARFPHGFQWP